MTTVTRWALVLAVLAVAAVVALLPREDPAPASAPDLGPARAAAALPACPATAGPAAGPLAGVATECLGDGARLDLGAALAGHTTLLNLWASWCPPCREELPVLDAYAASPGAARVLAVQVASPPADGLELLRSLGVHLPSAFDGEGTSGPVRAALRAPSGLPATYLVRPDGTARLIESPRVFESVAQVRAAVGEVA